MLIIRYIDLENWIMYGSKKEQDCPFCEIQEGKLRINAEHLTRLIDQNS
jgi:hypothetical protein